MTDLSREQIEWFRSKVMTYEDEYTRVLYGVCDMALRTRDAEAECERLREALMMARPFVKSWTGSRCNQAASEAAEVDKKIASALATPPPEGEPTTAQIMEAQQWPIGSDAPHTPEQNGWYCAHCERGVDPSEVTFHEAHEACGRIITDDSPPQQAHGDALAALNRIALIVYDEESPEPTFVGDMADEEFDVVRQALTASGVPYVPESIKNLPERMRSAAKEMQAQEPKPGSRLSGRIDEAWVWADELEVALASAPAVPDGMRTAWPTRDVLTKLAEAADILLYRYNHDDDGWEMIAHARDVARERAAAPTDGRE